MSKETTTTDEASPNPFGGVDHLLTTPPFESHLPRLLSATNVILRLLALGESGLDQERPTLFALAAECPSQVRDALVEIIRKNTSLYSVKGSEGVLLSVGSEAITEQLRELWPSAAWTEAFTEAMEESLRPSETETLRGLSIVQAFSVFEIATAACIEEHMCRHPAALGARTINLREVIDAPDRQSVIDAHMLGAIRELMMGSMEAREKWFSRHLGFTIESLAPDWSFVRVMQRVRNAIVHNDSCVTNELAQILREVDQQMIVANRHGRIPLHPGLVPNVVEHLTILGANLLMTTTTKLDGAAPLPFAPRPLASELNGLLRHGRFRTARMIAERFLQLVDVRPIPDDWVPVAVVALTAAKREGNLDAGALAALDALAQAHPGLPELCALSLLDRVDEGVAQLYELLSGGTLSVLEVRREPACDELVGDFRAQELLKRYGSDA